MREVNLKVIKNILASLAFFSFDTHAQESDVQVYGRIHLGIEDLRIIGPNHENTGIARISNYRSIIGFRGSENLENNLRTFFQIEGTISPDTGAGNIAQRDTRLGIQGHFGSAFAGHWVTPYNSSTSVLDPYYSTTAGYMSIMGNGAASSTDNVTDSYSFDRRQQNSLHYWTPNWNGWVLRLAQGLNEERPANGTRPSLTSVAAIYENKEWYLAISNERHHEYQGKGLDDRGTKFAIAYRMNNWRAALIAERLQYQTRTGTINRQSFYSSLTRQLGAHNLRVGLAWAGDGTGDALNGQQVGFIRKGSATGANHYTFGDEYALSATTSVFAYFTRLNNRRNGAYNFAINSVPSQSGATLEGIAVGMRKTF